LSPEKLAKQLAVVLTERIEVENLSVYALVALGRHPYTDWAGRLLAEDERVVQRALLDVGAAHLAHRHLGELSDGERQRVMIARALAQQPNVLILDEPTAFLDLPHRVEILSLLSRLARQNSCAILLSTHDLDLALRMADRLWLLPGNGQLVSGAPEELVLNQALTQAFHSEDVFFDMSQGGFRVRRYPCGPIDLYGEGVVAHWTAHALERIGFEVIQNAARPISPACIEVLRESGSAHWRLTVQRQTTIYTSLSDLVDYVASTPKMIHLEARHPETRHPGTRSERRNSTISMI
jgi:iron complex transport system ATP-binding protein